MLKIAPSPTFVASVAIPVPGGEQQLVNFTFNHMGKAALKAWIEAARDREDIDSIASIVCGWDGIDAEFLEGGPGVVALGFADVAALHIEDDGHLFGYLSEHLGQHLYSLPAECFEIG
jgi:hypothetical protein